MKLKMTKKMNQVLAVEKGVKVRTYSALTEMHKAAQVAALFQGFSKTYTPLAEDGHPQAPQTQKVQKNAEEMFAEAQKSLVDLWWGVLSSSRTTGRRARR